jgi:transcriptional regulator with XRE-family HTH domain
MSGPAYIALVTPKELRSRREAAGLKQVELAEALGYTERQIRRLEDGDTPIAKRHEVAIESVLSGKVGAKSPRTATAKA